MCENQNVRFQVVGNKDRCDLVVWVNGRAEHGTTRRGSHGALNKFPSLWNWPEKVSVDRPGQESYLGAAGVTEGCFREDNDADYGNRNSAKLVSRSWGSSVSFSVLMSGSPNPQQLLVTIKLTSFWAHWVLHTGQGVFWPFPRACHSVLITILKSRYSVVLSPNRVNWGARRFSNLHKTNMLPHWHSQKKPGFAGRFLDSVDSKLVLVPFLDCFATVTLAKIFLEIQEKFVRWERVCTPCESAASNVPLHTTTQGSVAPDHLCPCNIAHTRKKTQNVHYCTLKPH